MPEPISDEPKIDLFVPIEEHPLLTEADLRSPRRRRIALPLFLFAATCVSTFYVGAMGWESGFNRYAPDWRQGFIYMAAVIGILLTHEMGHFLQTLRYRVPASLPFFIPLPGMMTGTMGAVIMMDGREADRKQLFDIGISGPLAGLVVAIPIIIWGVISGDVAPPRNDFASGWHLNDPLVIQLLVHWLHPDVPFGGKMILNPLLMAGWVGMLITGLNMMPISQLDGGHVVYGLLGERAHWVAKGFVCAAIAAMLIFDSYYWLLMLVLVLFLGIEHPPTRHDDVKLGLFRTLIGWLSLLIPVFCFTPVPV